MTLDLALLAVFVSIGIAAFALQDRLIHRRRVLRSLQSIDIVDVSGTTLRQRELATSIVSRVLVPGMKRFSGAIGKATPGSILDRLNEQLVYAGNPPGWDAERVLAIKLLGTAGLTLAALLTIPLMGMPILRGLILAPIGAFLGWYAPEWALRSAADRRQEEIRRALPDALDLLSISVEAGLGFDAAMARVAREMRGPLAGEFARVVQETRLGSDRAKAMRGLSERTTVDELKGFVLAMIQAEIFGIAIAGVLRVQATQLRQKRRQHAEEKAQKVPVKIVFPLILGIFPALFVVILGPAGIAIYENIIKR